MSKRARPVSRAAADDLRAYLQTEGLEAGDVIDSEHRLAEKLGVSRGTVRHAIDLLVGTGELTRRPNCRPTVGLTKEPPLIEGNRLEVLVWVSHPISDNASLMFLRGVSLGLKGTPFRMIVREPTRFFGEHVQSDERQFLQDLLDNENAAAAIIQRDPSANTAELMNAVQRKGIPLIFVDSAPPEGVNADFVGTANVAAARECVDHLIELGHRRIVCVVEMDYSDVVQQRIRGYWRALRNAGSERFGKLMVANQMPIPDMSMRPAGEFAGRIRHGAYSDWAQRLARAILAMPERPTAIFAGCDVLAHTLAAYLRGAGIAVPDQMSIAGFDWLARWEQNYPDELTSAGQDFEGFGRHAADLLLDRLTGVASAAPRHVLLPANLVVRSSTGPCPVYEPALTSPGEVALLNYEP